MKKVFIKKVAPLCLSAMLFVGVLTACGGSNKIENEILPYPVTVNNVTVEKAPKAVATLSPTLTKMLIDLGFLKKIVGFSEGEVLPEPPPEEPVSSDTGFRWFWEPEPEPYVPEPMPESGEIGTAITPNYEMISKYLPEIIFTTLPLPNADMEKLNEVGIKVVVLPMAKTIEDLKQNYIALFRAMAGENEANATGKPLLAELERQLLHIQSVVPAQKLSVLYVCSTEPLVVTKDTYEGTILSILANNAAGEAKNYTMTNEELVAIDPDMIIFPEGFDPEFFSQSELFKDKKAVTEGKVYSIDKTLLLDQSLGMAVSLQKLATVIYPGIDFTVPEPVSSDSESEAGTKKKDKEPSSKQESDTPQTTESK